MKLTLVATGKSWGMSELEGSSEVNQLFQDIAPSCRSFIFKDTSKVANFDLHLSSPQI